MKKNIFILCLGILVFFAMSCGNNDDSNDTGGVVVETGKVTFFNESSYKVIVHRDFFSGPVLLELGAGESKRVDVRTSDNYGTGTTFSIEYLYRITDAFDAESGEVIASGIDSNVQINRVIEADKSYTIQIPQPANLEFQSAFIKILNSYSLQFELRYLGTTFKQAGNGNISVAPGKTGVYKLEGIPEAGKLFQNYTVVTNFASTTIPDFTAKNGFIYSFTYNGTSVTKTGEQNIVFNNSGSNSENINWIDEPGGTLTMQNNTSKDMILFHGWGLAKSKILGGVKASSERHFDISNVVDDFNTGGYIIIQCITIDEYNNNKDTLSNAKIVHSAIATYKQGTSFRSTIEPECIGNYYFLVTNQTRVGIELRKNSPDGEKLGYIPPLAAKFAIYCSSATIAVCPKYVYYDQDAKSLVTQTPASPWTMVDVTSSLIGSGSAAIYTFTGEGVDLPPWL